MHTQEAKVSFADADMAAAFLSSFPFSELGIGDKVSDTGNVPYSIIEWFKNPSEQSIVDLKLSNPTMYDRATFIDLFTQLAKLESFLNESNLGIYLELKKQASYKLRSYLGSLNTDEKRRFCDALVSSSAFEVIDWKIAQGEADNLAILYNFSPYVDTGAVVASKRMREFGKVYDLISCSFENRKRLDLTVSHINAPYLGEALYLPLIPTWASWKGYVAFARRSARIVEERSKIGKNYKELYTRAMWAPSHYAGFLIKNNNPQIIWKAEFSDPLSLDVEGLPRSGETPEGELADTMLSAIENRYGSIPEEYRTIFGLAELASYAFADELLFTNDNQLATMLEHIYSDDLRERVMERAKVSNHPTLPSEYYNISTVEYEVDSSKINIAYFGEFYATRGLTEFTTAIRCLPLHLREKVHLHVFTNYIPSVDGGTRPRGMSAVAFNDLVQRALDGIGGAGIEEQISLNSALPYLDFLAITNRFDCLLVNDARSGEHHAVNPYLPSKWSDYAGSQTKTWAFVEEGSILSTKPATIKTSLGDIGAIVVELEKLIEEKAV